MKILVTGSAGFIAGYVIQKLLDEGNFVVGIDNFSKYGKTVKSYDNHPNYKFIESDAKNTDVLKELLIDCDQMLCLAALVGGISYFHEFPYDIISENEKITAASFDSAIWAFKNYNLKKINIVSSSMVYENSIIFPSKEDDIYKIPPPLSSYGFQKLSCEYFARAAYEQYGLPYTIIRPFNCVGTGESKAIAEANIKSGNVLLTMSHVVPDIIKKILLGQNPLHIFGDGSQIRYFTYGEDIARGVLLCLQKKQALNQAFNLSSNKSMSILELSEIIWKKINNSPFKWISDT
ncbi:MAG: NAD-dependent epimerase/dehydratase family protein, partial [Candidatus Muirbacterium halophilum]|nr:NAD-dependent epimerase/dehydratase family protein [Candidatus Muirbacterium halophilum]